MNSRFLRMGVSLMAMVLLLLTGTTTTHAQQKQKFSVASFELDQFDLTAQNDQHKKVDGNGSLYAIIKVTSSNPNDKLSEYLFNFGNMNHEVVNRDGELWVYVQRNAKYVTISRQDYITINKYDLGTTIEAGKTYTMQLSVTAAPIYTQMVQFNVQPTNSNAVVMVKSTKADAHEELFGTTDNTGGVAKSLQYGTYTYRVVAENYHASQGRITLNDRTTTHVEKIILRPNFSEITLKVNSEADIYVNGEKKGRRTWTGILQAGDYQIECKQTNYRSSTQYIHVEENNNRTIDLTPPTPITGILAISSRPLGARIYIDGKDYGLTPQNINDLLIGQHTVTLSRENYKNESKTIEIEEQKTTHVNITLSDMAQMTIKSQPSDAQLYINGEQVGTTPYTAEMVSGDYDVRLTRYKYRDFNKKIHLSSSQPEVFLNLTRQYQRPLSFYLQGNFQVGSLMGYGGSIGAYFSNINVEGFLTIGMQSVDLYGYNSNGDHERTFHLIPTMYGIKVGYGFILGTRLRITPQLGLARLSVGGGSSLTANATLGTIGLRGEYAFASNFGVSLSPEYQLNLNKQDVYKQLSNSSTEIKGWSPGFNVRLGVYLYF